MRKYAEVFNVREATREQFPKQLNNLLRLMCLVFHSFSEVDRVAIGQ